MVLFLVLHLYVYFLKRLLYKLKSLGSLRFARTNMPSVHYVCAMICTDTEVASGIARANGKSVLVETFKTDVTNSILEIRLAAYCRIFGTQLLYLKPDRGTGRN
jgi:hypothetical protein